MTDAKRFVEGPQLSEQIGDLLQNKAHRYRAAELGIAIHKENGVGNAARILDTLTRQLDDMN